MKRQKTKALVLGMKSVQILGWALKWNVNYHCTKKVRGLDIKQEQARDALCI